jgi:hypothetical protein
MFTLFFGGSDFAPLTRVGDEPVQEFLQRHYIAAIQQVALRLRDLPNVIGYGTMNELLPGYIGWQDLKAAGGVVLLGACPTPYQAMLLGAGLPQEVGVWGIGLASIRRKGKSLLNAGGQRAWQEGRPCIWQQNGVWDFDGAGRPHLLHPDHFCRVNGRAVDTDIILASARALIDGLNKLDRLRGARTQCLVVRPPRLEDEARQFEQRLLIDVALELDHRFERHPVLVPSPGVELGVRGRAQADVAVASHQAKQKPDLLLTAVVPAQLAPDPLFRDVVTQPFAGATHDLHVLGLQSDFLPELAKHRLLR